MENNNVEDNDVKDNNAKDNNAKDDNEKDIDVKDIDVEDSAVKNIHMNNAPTFKRVLLMAGGVIVGCFVLVVALLYMKSYDIRYELKTFSQFWDENNMMEQFTAEGNQINMVIPENVVNTEMMLRMNRMQETSRYKVKNVQLESEVKRINMNGSLFGINVPISMRFDPILQDGKVIVNFKELIIGQIIKLNQASSQKMLKYLFENNMPLVLDAKSLFHSDMVIINRLNWEEKDFNISIQINEKLFRSELARIKSTANEEVLSSFENSTVETEKLAAEYINNLDQLSAKEIEHIIKDIVSNGEITGNLLMIAEPSTSREIYDEYNKNLKSIDFNQLTEKRKIVLSEQLKPYRTALYTALDTIYFEAEPMHINKAQLYSVSKHQYITPLIIATEESLTIPEKTLKRLSFFYDKESGLLLLAYKLDDNEYLMMYGDEFKTMPASAYQEGLKFEDTGRVSHVNDKATWDSLVSEIKAFYQEEEVFIRYLKADDRYAFAVASPKYNYQSFKALAFEKKDEKWMVLVNDVNSISELNKAFPEFNLETATMDIEKVTIYQLGEDMFEVILEDMMDKGVINSKKDLSITYCSYGNDYIAFSLSNNKEYVYKVYSLYLHTVYDKVTAKKTWVDLPEIITLQDPPTE